jgi:endoglucanase
VTAIRAAGATSQIILLPGNDWTGAATFVSDGSLAALSTVKNLDGTTTNLIFDIHKYCDSDGSGTHAECVTNNIATAFEPLASSLRAIGRQAMLTETGGGNTASCVEYVCQELAYVNENADVYLGYTGVSHLSLPI